MVAGFEVGAVNEGIVLGSATVLATRGGLCAFGGSPIMEHQTNVVELQVASNGQPLISGQPCPRGAFVHSMVFSLTVEAGFGGKPFDVRWKGLKDLLGFGLGLGNGTGLAGKNV